MFHPDFEQLLKVLRKECPDRPVLFEYFLNDGLHRQLCSPALAVMNDPLATIRCTIHAFRNAGYDYATLHPSAFGFPAGTNRHELTKSLNEGCVITNRAEFEAYAWPNPDDFPLQLDAAAAMLPQGMKIMIDGPSGVLENVINLTGYDNLCYMLFEDPALVGDVFNAVGQRIYRHYERAIGHPAVGVLMCNDDWGFNTQTFLSPADMRKYVFPWHKAIVDLAHDHGKPVILHSCGYMGEVIEDVISMGFDGKHSYEDNILPVEQAYEQYGRRIAVLGGIDVDYVVSRPKEDVYARSRAMAERGLKGGGYALGTGNSVPYFVPYEQYMAMISASNDLRKETERDIGGLCRASF